MMTYLVIGICLILLIVVVYISAKPISMGIEARRNIKEESQESKENDLNINEYRDEDLNDKNSISDEIMKLKKLKNEGILTEEEYQKAKNKVLN